MNWIGEGALSNRSKTLLHLLSRCGHQVGRSDANFLICFIQKERNMSLGTILLIVLILILVGAFPTWPHSKSWGYGPSGGLGLIVVILLVLLLMGRI